MTQDERIAQKSLLKIFEKDPDNSDVVHTMQGFWVSGKSSCLDVRGVTLPPTLLTLPTRKAASLVARLRGYSAFDVHLAANTSHRFCVVGQWVEFGETLRCAGETVGQTVLVTLRASKPREQVT